MTPDPKDPALRLVVVCAALFAVGTRAPAAEPTAAALAAHARLASARASQDAAAADHMINHDIGRLPVVARQNPGKVIGIIARSDVLSAGRRRLQEIKRAAPTFSWLGMATPQK